MKVVRRDDLVSQTLKDVLHVRRSREAQPLKEKPAAEATGPSLGGREKEAGSGHKPPGG
jgi:hypothetical protein